MEHYTSLPHGIFLVTGPTGSGKSTTLYSALKRINQTDKKIITIEDPVEYQMDGINQIHVNPQIGLTFAAGLRHIVRQDPDVIMVGEIRDRETADIAIRSALTGHFVYLDAAHQRRAQRDHAPDRHGRRELPDLPRRWSRFWRSAWCASSASTASVKDGPELTPEGDIHRNLSRRGLRALFRHRAIRDASASSN